MTDIEQELLRYGSRLESLYGERFPADLRVPSPRRKVRLVFGGAIAGVAVIVAALAIVSGGDPPTKVESASTAAPLGEQIAGSWRELDTTTTVADLSTAVVWTGDEAIAIHPESSSGRVWGERLDLGGGGAQRLSESPLGWRAHPTVAWDGQRVLVMGGSSGPGLERFGAAYDPAADSWEVLSDPPGFDPSRSATDLGDGAWTGREVIFWRAALAYLPEEDAWRELSPAPIDLSDRTDTGQAVNGGSLVVWGGCVQEAVADLPCEFDAQVSTVTQGARYDIAEDAWRALPPSPLEEGDAPILLPKGAHELLVVVGAPGRGDGSAAVFDLDSEAWRQFGVPVEFGSMRQRAVAWSEGTAYFVGGAPMSPGNVALSLNLDSLEWSALDGVGPSTRSASAVVVDGGRLLVAGGEPEFAPRLFER